MSAIDAASPTPPSGVRRGHLPQLRWARPDWTPWTSPSNAPSRSSPSPPSPASSAACASAPSRSGSRTCSRPIGLSTTPIDDTTSVVLYAIRAPRVLAAFCVGAALAAGGAALQSLFRNPLADPGLLGVSSGAALAAVSVIVLGERVMHVIPPDLRPWLLPVAAFGGGLVATTIVYRLAAREGVTLVGTLLLAGIAINAADLGRHRHAGVRGRRPAASHPDLLDHGRLRRRHLGGDHPRPADPRHRRARPCCRRRTCSTPWRWASARPAMSASTSRD